MPSQKNVHQLAEIVKSLNDSKAVILADYAGLTVKEQTSLRSEVAKVGGSFMVAKNNLMKRALQEKNPDLANEIDTFLSGPTAVLFSPDPVDAAKIVEKFAEDHEQLKVKSGIMEDKVITVLEIKSLSKLPSRSQLIATLLAQLQAPAQSLVRQLQAPMQNFVYGLQALKAKLS